MIPYTALLLHSFHIHILMCVCVCVLYVMRAWDQAKRLKDRIWVFESRCACACGPPQTPTVRTMPQIPLVFYVNVLQAWNDHSRHKPSSHRHAGMQWRRQKSSHKASLCHSVCGHWELVCYLLWLNTAQLHTCCCIHIRLAPKQSLMENITEFSIYRLRWSIPRAVKWGKREKMLPVNCCSSRSQCNLLKSLTNNLIIIFPY